MTIIGGDNSNCSDKQFHLYRLTIYLKCHWIAARYNRRHEEAHLVGLSGAGRVPLPDPSLSALQRRSGEAGGAGTGTVSADAGDQGHAGGRAAANSRISHAHANPPP